MRTVRTHRGFTLLEALVALLVMSLGMLSFAALQARLRVNSDVSKQRAEAVRIAQEDMENLRSFSSLIANATIANNFAYSSITSGAAQKSVSASGVVTTTNASYTLTRSVVASAVAGMSDLRVRVAWTDREGVAQNVVLRSIIARMDPKLAAALAIAPNGSPVRDPLGRDVQIPIPAKNLGDGTSVFKPVSSGNIAFVFNNDSGFITKKCDAVGSSTYTASITADSLSGYNCTAVNNGFLLSGHVRFSLGSTPSAASPNDSPPGAANIRLDLDDTTPPANAKGTTAQLTATYWPASSEPARVGGYTAPDCAAEYSKTVRFTTPVNYSQQNNGTTQTVTSTTMVAIVPADTAITSQAIAPYVNLPASSVQSPTDTGERYVGYTCIVYPRQVNGVMMWTGRSLVVPTGWTIGTSTTEYKVCRYSADYNLNGHIFQSSDGNVTRIDNAEHPYAYLSTDTGLNNQNFLVVKGDKTCPTDSNVEVDGSGGENYSNETTEAHQQ